MHCAELYFTVLHFRAELYFLSLYFTALIAGASSTSSQGSSSALDHQIAPPTDWLLDFNISNILTSEFNNCPPSNQALSLS